MATINVYHAHEHAGAVWVNACVIWGDYVSHEDWSFARLWTVFSNGTQDFLALKIIITDPVDTHNYWLIFLDTPVFSGSGRNAPHYVMSRPGFQDSGPIRLPTYGDRDTIQD